MIKKALQSTQQAIVKSHGTSLAIGGLASSGLIFLLLDKLVSLLPSIVPAAWTMTGYWTLALGIIGLIINFIKAQYGVASTGNANAGSSISAPVNQQASIVKTQEIVPPNKGWVDDSENLPETLNNALIQRMEKDLEQKNKIKSMQIKSIPDQDFPDEIYKLSGIKKPKR